MSDDFVENLKQPSQWLRILIMLALAVILNVVWVVVTVLVVAQALFSLLTGGDNEDLRRFGKSLNLYVHQILEFLTYNSELRPFPFSPYPVPGSDESGSPATDKDTDMEVHVEEAADIAEPESESKPVRKTRRSSPKKASSEESGFDGAEE